MCPFANTCSVVFKSREENRQWAYFSHPGSTTPVKRLALNLGAPGDQRDPSGSLWFGYPRPGGSLVLQLKAGLAFFPGWSYFKHDPARLEIEGTDRPWVFRSGVSGLRQCTVPVAEPGDGKARYTVRLAFAELEHEAAGKRVFDIKVQGQIVVEGFDVFKEAGGKNIAIVEEFKGIDAEDKLTVEFVAKVANPASDQLPILQGIEVEREQVLTLGFTVPSFLLNDSEPEQTGQVVIVNNKESDFAGTLHIDAPAGFTITPAETQVQVPSGLKATVALKAVVGKKGPAEKHRIGIKLVRPDGTIESEREVELEYLGDLRRAVLKAVEDTHAHHTSPTTNYATSASVNVDGGDRQMGDHHHSIAYLKFRVDVDGKPRSAMLRLYNAGNPTGDSGQIRVVTEPWTEKSVTYNARPKLGDVVAKIGPVTENQVVELPLKLSLEAGKEMSLAIDPTGCDGVNYISREGGKPAELVVEYVR